MDLGIAGKVALVTASSKGLGYASARALIEDGARVVICGRGEEALGDAAAELGQLGDVHAVAADVTDADSAARLVRETVDRFGALDILVANNGGPPPGRALDIDDAGLDAALEANLKSSIRLVRHAVPHMRTAGWGRICLITSVSVKQPIPNLALSNTARTALWAWAKTAAADLFREGITLNLACPGSHATDRMKQLAGSDVAAGSMGNPADFGRVVAFLCSAHAAFISGTAVNVDGGAVLGLL
jgi:3-oxoacyl-[acyl-carrier protein] reductase